MKKEKGFTLAELIGVVVLLGLIALIIGRSVVKNLTEAKEEITSSQEKAILNAAEKWAIDNSHKFDDIDAQSMMVGLDVVFVLDMSGSMSNADIVGENGKKITRYEAMINATNSAMKELVTVNPDTRMGLVLYGSVGDVFLPLANYSVQSGDFLFYNKNQFVLSTNSNLKKDGNSFPTIYKELEGCTYTQAGIAQGANLLISANNTNNRIPVIIMLSDGAPSIGTTYYTDVLSYNGRRFTNSGQCATIGDADSSYLSIQSAFYYKNAIKKKYNGVSNFFYTIGFALNPGSYEEAVLNPEREKMEALGNSNNNISKNMYNKWVRDGKIDYSYANASFVGKMDSETLNRLFLQISNEVIEAAKITQLCVTIEDLYKEGYLTTKDVKLADGQASSEYVIMSMNEATNQYTFSIARTDEQKNQCQALLNPSSN